MSLPHQVVIEIDLTLMNYHLHPVPLEHHVIVILQGVQLVPNVRDAKQEDQKQWLLSMKFKTMANFLLEGQWKGEQKRDGLVLQNCALSNNIKFHHHIYSVKLIDYSIILLYSISLTVIEFKNREEEEEQRV